MYFERIACFFVANEGGRRFERAHREEAELVRAESSVPAYVDIRVFSPPSLMKKSGQFSSKFIFVQAVPFFE